MDALATLPGTRRHTYKENMVMAVITSPWNLKGCRKPLRRDGLGKPGSSISDLRVKQMDDCQRTQTQKFVIEVMG
jgi:hypothetical protein